MFFAFLARQMARQNSGISVDSRMFERVLESLCNAPSMSAGDDAVETSNHEERQQALLELLNTRALDHFNEDRLLSLSNAAKFFRVSEMLYGRRREFGRILECYCLDKARRNLVFAYMKQTIASPDISVEEKKRVREAVLEHLEDLVHIDAKRTTKLVTANLGISLTEAVNQVIRFKNEDMAFDFLRCLFEMIGNCVGGSAHEDWQFDPSVYERYVELLCRRSVVEDVVAFLRFHNGYRLTKTLEICQRFRISEAVIVLLEKSGDVTGAFEVSLQTLRTKLSCIVRSDVLHRTQMEELKTVQVAVETIISLLNRNFQRLEQLQLRELWFTLFDVLIDNYYRLFGCKLDSSEVDVSAGICRTASNEFGGSDSTGARDKYQSVLQHTVSCMVSHVPFADVLDHMVTLGDEDGIASCFGNVRDLLSSVMDACQYRQTLYTTCARVVHQDVNGALGRLTIAARSPVSLHFNSCSACRQPLSEERCSKLEVICFQCGHAFHHVCLRDAVDVAQDGEESGAGVKRQWHCTVCSGSQSPLTVPFARSRVAHVTEQSASEVDSAASQSPMFSAEMESVNQLRRNQRTESRFELLSELRRLDELKTVRSSNVWKDAGMVLDNGSAFCGEKFSLKLAPPPAQ